MAFVILIFVLIFIINSTDKCLSVHKLSDLNGKARPTFVEIFGQGWEKDQNSNWQNDQNELNLEDSIGNDQNNEQFDDQQKREIVHKFHAIKEKIKKIGKYSAKVRTKIEQKIGVKLGINRLKIYYYEKKKQEFVERIEEFKRMSKYGKQKQIAEELGISEKTFYIWKNKFGIEMGKRYSKEEKMSKMNDYYKNEKS